MPIGFTINLIVMRRTWSSLGSLLKILSNEKTSQPAQKRVRTTKSIKIGCPASIYKHIITDGTVCIKYNWQYPNHNPFKIEEISLSRLPDELKQWVEGLVSQNMDWKSIKNMLRMSEDRLLELEQAGDRSSFPSSLLIDYQYVRNVINARMMKLSRKHVDHYKSVKLWVQELNESENTTLFTVHKNGLFLVLWVSEWQKEFLENLEEWCIDSTHKTSKAWEVNVKKHIKVQNSTHALNIACNSVYAVLSNMMHATTSVAYNTLYNEFLVKFGEYENFILFFNRMWVRKKELWCKTWRLAATFHTNNLIESYYNQLKTFYLGRARFLQADKLIYLLAKVLTLDYRQENVKTLYEF
ncbi:hypothetical protein PHYBLDRAFT_71578 [Phycomyces blakesleeanus NRRL 1555(-)]|uniref:Uncharacterized protein n=1 Tax=Phycomyces blakesleeanus (strain ATCC 8743b / DSM 1359 / FGSC 10004 / NBRC 33097 / NRRL 1555) TaxID=763407 RepID=A0A163AFA2_PHYB8|nr:hypothetical protein PHYBLDRAFT_71578 [Phycomyces blakesleeanus NRRL 1555(-)]OAD73091.1 hypothetical protein PHYBLDRAFT_71578 [Phycomyces blakesleeanus NRRL 1555(-)]|eukprot:XP_018291131.1 hypothetical protein PHYBLDRAFT_71578 [Phycomyces blakesleeanus NRRL 1555(-)]